MFVSFTKHSSKSHFFEICDDAFCFLIEYFESGVLDLVDSLELFDDEFTIHDEMDFCCSELFRSSESEDCPHVFCLVIGRRSQEKFPSFYHLGSLAHDKSAPAWAGVSSRSSICVKGVYAQNNKEKNSKFDLSCDLRRDYLKVSQECNSILVAFLVDIFLSFF